MRRRSGCAQAAIPIAVLALMFGAGAAVVIYRLFVNPGYSEPFQPSIDDSQIVAINKRRAERNPCSTQRTHTAWPTDRQVDAQTAFARKVQNLGATTGACGMLQIDRELVELALQVAVQNRSISPLQLAEYRRKADRQLFKENARTFVLLHKYDAYLHMSEAEPYLISEHQHRGRLVGMSIGAARGFRPGKVGMLMFEDRVCADDLSFSITFPELSDRRIFNSVRCHEFIFGGESDILAIITAAYASHVPEAARVDPSSGHLSPVDALAVAQFAFDLLKLFSAL